MLGATDADGRLAGRVLGDFVVVERLAAGGHGEVWRAEQVALHRPAVIKVMRGAGEAARQRFLREAQLASRIDHPYAAHVYAFGAEPDGLLWIAMERIRGVSLAELLERQGPLPVERFTPLFERLCEVVQTAHEAGIVHRDLKPANVMVVARAGRLLPKLLDLGIARAFADVEIGEGDAPSAGAAPAPTGDATLTQVGDVVGSPAFMAPEQWFDPAGVDHRADVYALGVLAYAALSGRLPFDGPTPRDVARAHAKQAPPPLGGDLPAALDAALGRALAKRREDRVGSALELAALVRSAAAVAAPPELPGLSSTVHDAVLSSAPPPIADALAAYDAARDVAGGLAAIDTVARALVRWLAVVAVACRARQGEWGGAARSAMASLRGGALADRDWLALARAAIAETPPELWPVPEVARAAADGSLDELCVDVAADASLAVLTARVAVLERALRAASFILDYPVVVRRGDRLERWTGTRRRRRPAAWVRDASALEPDAPALLDADGAIALSLAPLAVVALPAPGAEAELFVIDRGSPEGAVLITFPDGFEHRDDPWPALAAALPVADGAAAVDADERSPYRGLEPFGTADAGLYVGREAEADAAANRLRDGRVLAVVGPSGAGKSSFLLAAVLPRLSGIRTVVMRPGAAPRAALARAADASAPFLLVVDQLEELVTACSDPAERAGFARDLAAHLDAGGALAVTVRDDFLLRVVEIGDLRRRLEPALQLLATPPRDQLVRILVEPARRAGHVFDDAALPEAMVDEVVGRPGALPLLSFTASRLWRERDRRLRQLTRRAHDAIGGVAGALAGHADAVVAALGPARERQIRDAFRNLATAEGTRAVLRRAELREVLGAGADDVIDPLIDARLLVTTEDADGDRIELVHEALLEAWPRLKAWRRDDAETARIRDQLRTAARHWDDRARPRGLLWRGDALDEYRLWRARYPGALTAREQAFADASHADARRSRNLRRGALAAVVAGLALAAGLLSIANREARRQEAGARVARSAADHSAAEARGRMIDLLVEQGRTAIFADQPMQGLVWLDEAYRQGAAESIVRPLAATAARSLDRVAHVFALHRSRVGAAGLSPDGSVLVTGGGFLDGTVRITDVATGATRATITTGTGTVDVAFSPRAPEVAIGTDDGRVRIVDTTRGAVTAELERKAPIVMTRYDGQGRLLVADLGGVATIRSGTGVMSWSAAAGRFDAHWLPDGSILTVSLDGHLARWTARGEPLGPRVSIRPALIAAVDGGGHRAAVISYDNPVVDIWDLDTRRRLASVRGHRFGASSVAISADGALVATGGPDGGVRLWDAATGALRSSLDGHRGTVSSLQFSPDDRWLVSAGEDGTLRLWDVATASIAAIDHVHLGGVLGAGFGGDGRWIVSRGLDGIAALWPAAVEGMLGEVATDGGVAAHARWMPDGSWFASGVGWRARRYRRDGTLERTYDDGVAQPAIPTGNSTWSIRRAVAVDAAGRLVAAPSGDGAVVWEAASGTVVGRCRGSSRASAIALSPDGKYVAVGDEDGSLTVCDRERQTRVTLEGHRRGVRAIAFSPDGERLVSAGDDRVALLWTPTQRVPLATMAGHTGAVTDVACAADGRVATAGVDGTVRIWSASGALEVVLADSAVLSAVAWSRDGSALAAGREDGSVTVWNAATRTAVARVGRNPGAVAAVAFSEDGRRLFTAAGGIVRTWNVDDRGGTRAAVARRVACLPYELVGHDVRPRPHPTCASRP